MNKHAPGWVYEDLLGYECWLWVDEEDNNKYVRVDHNKDINAACVDSEWEYTSNDTGWQPLPDNPNIRTIEERLAFALVLARME